MRSSYANPKSYICNKNNKKYISSFTNIFVIARSSQILALAVAFVLLGGHSPNAVGIELSLPKKKKKALKDVTLQLKWTHQFQFAGFYAAQRNGYFAEEGLRVELREGSPDKNALEKMLEGQADFAVAGTEVLLARLEGEPTVACAVFFQHSPYALLTDAKDNLRRPSDLVGKRISVSGSGGVAQFRAMLIDEGISPESVDFSFGKWSMTDLLEGRVDAISGYATTQAPRLQEMGLEPYKIMPINYGVDFYGDTLCTTEDIAYGDRETTEAMIRASIRGWKYAMNHPEELADFILELPGVKGRLSRKQLLQEAELMQMFVVPDVVEIGNMNPGRWQNIASTFQKTGLARIPGDIEWLDKFTFSVAGDKEPVSLKFIGLTVSFIGLVAMLIAVWNMILRRQVEEATAVIRTNSKLNQQLLDTAMDAVIGVDSSGNVVQWSGQANRIFESTAEKAVGRTVEFFLPDLLSRVSKDLKESEFERLEIKARRTDGTSFPAEVSLSKVPESSEIWLNMFVRDMTEQQGLEEKLRQSQKMQAIGQLAGGIAHDFNNLLTVIQGNAVLAAPEATEGNRPRLDEIVEATGRASELTRQLLAFSRRQPMKLKSIEINECVEGVGTMLKRLIGEDIVLGFDLCEESTRVNADPAMLEQVVLNLAVNSRDAMPQGGKFTISTSIESLNENAETLPEEIEAGDFVRTRISDTGTGIEPDKLPHIFEPFFTTKEVGKGTGLGLATAFGIVQQHGGWMSVESEPGVGTEFSVWLPLQSEHPSNQEECPTTTNRRDSSALKGTETIFLVEDEAMVRLIAKKVFLMNGYRVIEAADGRAALDVWKEHRDEIDLLVTDVVMPEGIAGHDLAEKLKKDKPELAVIYTSGYSAEIFRGEAVIPDDATFLPKPYLPDELLQAVKENLTGVALPS